MAKEINFVRPQEVYDKETKKSVLQYGGYDGKPKKVVMSDSLDADVKGVIDDTFVPNASGNVVFTDSNDNTHELVIAENAGGGGGIIVVATTLGENEVNVTPEQIVTALRAGQPVQYLIGKDGITAGANLFLVSDFHIALGGEAYNINLESGGLTGTHVGNYVTIDK